MEIKSVSFPGESYELRCIAAVSCGFFWFVCFVTDFRFSLDHKLSAYLLHAQELSIGQTVMGFLWMMVLQLIRTDSNQFNTARQQLAGYLITASSQQVDSGLQFESLNCNVCSVIWYKVHCKLNNWTNVAVQGFKLHFYRSLVIPSMTPDFQEMKITIKNIFEVLFIIVSLLVSCSVFLV